MSDRSEFEAVIFDFDGLVVDTETPLYEAWRATFEEFGLEPVGIEQWAHSLGRGDDDPELVDPFERIRAVHGDAVSVGDVQAARRRRRDELLAEQQVMPGVLDLLDEADRLRVSVGVASSSPIDWVERHLGDRHLRGRFEVVSCAGDGVPGKPDPAVYLKACEALGSAPHRSIAFEDSPHGVAAAKAAGLVCVAVPTVMGSSLDFSHADRVVATLDGVHLRDLTGLLDD